ncbi:uncharacterized protein ALTATR162_LOCUS5930 [Alternaria atra]|uniref:Uncharacterized protein n=1 Tax=Alternaria atra TaxID=119953 RepID=A0A8J2I3K0_9PLEO|nr:uncharacterized protein ALTATR162_LOCUS5930 [Alternaria atra]CAG5160916.1 unnamed protein product [Alternaria atra]
MDTSVTPTPKIPYDLVRIAVRENLPSVTEPAQSLEETMDSIRLKINILQDIVDAPVDDEKNPDMTDAVHGLLKELAVVEERFKVWYEKLNLACVMIGLVYPLQNPTPETQRTMGIREGLPS